MEELQELWALAERGRVAEAERRLRLWASASLPGTSGAVLAALSLPPKYQGVVFRTMLLATINADEPSAAVRWLTGFARLLDGSSSMTIETEQGAPDGPDGTEVLGRLLGKVHEGTGMADRWFAALEFAGPLAELLRHRALLAAHAGNTPTVERLHDFMLSTVPST
ncbi:unnamed protein product [Effrenium voratum]|nr:unnamed protein product [Effrenium voratum]